MNVPAGAIKNPSAGRARIILDHLRLHSSAYLVAGITALIFVLNYAPNLTELYTTWRTDENYSHGMLVIPFALAIHWRRIQELGWEPGDRPARLTWLGPIGLIVVLLARAVAYELSLQWVENATLIPAIVCLVWSFGGWPWLRLSWPAIAFLIFMLPLPNAINNRVALPLQKVAAIGSCFLLQLSGLWAVRSGNLIRVEGSEGPAMLDVALACNGLSMLMSLAAVVTATLLLLPMPNWKRIVLLLSVIPIALLSNMVRIFATGWAYHLMSSHLAKEWAHTLAGWLMMPMALVLVLSELALLAWLAPAGAEGEDDGKLIVASLAERRD